MSKARKRRTSRRGTTDKSATTDIVTQLETSIRNPHAALIGGVLGGLLPWFGRTLAHGELPVAWSAGNYKLVLLMVVAIAGCSLVSAISVHKFGRAAFGDARKALGFVLALEGVMLIAHGVTGVVALGALILINAVANGAVIALARDASQRRRAADARGAATRASQRTAARGTVGTGQGPVPQPSRPQVPEAPPVWRRAKFHDDVIDAEIVSAQRFLA